MRKMHTDTRGAGATKVDLATSLTTMLVEVWLATSFHCGNLASREPATTADASAEQEA
jgi:hypothetical protein